MRKFFRILSFIVIVGVILIVTVLSYLTVDEYNPQNIETLSINGNAGKRAAVGTSIRLMTWNLGFGALGDNADFFMDGGKMVYTASKERVYSNLTGIMKEVEAVNPDIFFAQEIDTNSARTYFIDQSDYLMKNSPAPVFDGQNAYATNYRVAFVPVPLPPIGKVEAGIEIFSEYKLNSAIRMKLPCPFSWPLRTMNLKRCLEVCRIPVTDSDKELVLINLHLEAYDDGEGKIEQTKVLNNLLSEEVAKGNYVIAGGDFNQTFSNIDKSAYPVVETAPWQPGVIEVSDFDKDLSFNMDNEVPSGRSLDSVLANAPSKDPVDFQYYILDGFIVSSNIDVEAVTTEDLGFVCSDHNPVIMDFKLK